MVICFDCNRRTKTEIDGLMATGRYRDLGELVAVAVANLAVLHARVATEGTVVIDGGPRESGSNGRVRAEQKIRPAARDRSDDAVAGWRSSLLPVDEPPERFAPISLSPSEPGRPVPLTNWVFGQFNRLLPAKVNCRMLAHLIRHEPNGVGLSTSATTIVRHAAVLGDYLASLDRRYEIDRDQALATAFPRTGNEGDKGRMRYANQFVANSNKAGELSGLLIDLKLINSVPGKEPRLLLTEPGWNFARLPNPIIDGSTDLAENLPLTKLTDEEQRFLLDHIQASVPVERFAYSAITEAINGGADTPSELDAALLKYAPRDKRNNTSFLSSQRSGAVSRMSDLGLICRIRDGVKVRYAVTDAARALLSN